MPVPPMRQRITGLEALTWQTPDDVKAEYLRDVPFAELDPEDRPAGYAQAGCYLPSTWAAVDIYVVWLLVAPPADEGDLVLAVAFAAYADGDPLGADSEVGRVTIDAADVTPYVMHETLVAEAVEVPGDGGRLGSIRAYRDPDDADDTISLTGGAILACVIVRPNYSA